MNVNLITENIVKKYGVKLFKEGKVFKLSCPEISIYVGAESEREAWEEFNEAVKKRYAFLLRNEVRLVIDKRDLDRIRECDPGEKLEV